MKKDDFTAIAHLLDTNGVGFVRVDFRFNETPNLLKEDEKWVIHFSDGKTPLGSLTIDDKSIDSLVQEDTGNKIIVRAIENEFTGYEKKIGIIFTIGERYNLGTCTIFIDE